MESLPIDILTIIYSTVGVDKDSGKVGGTGSGKVTLSQIERSHLSLVSKKLNAAFQRYIAGSEYLNVAMIFYCEQGYKTAYDRMALLAGIRWDPSIYDNNAIYTAVFHDRFVMVEALLKDNRVNPTDGKNRAIKAAMTQGSLGSLRILIYDAQIDPFKISDLDPILDTIVKQDFYDVIKLLVNDSRMTTEDMKFIIRCAFNRQKRKILKILLDSDKINITDVNDIIEQFGGLRRMRPEFSRLLISRGCK
jgi:hypothetical protein